MVCYPWCAGTPSIHPMFWSAMLELMLEFVSACDRDWGRENRCGLGARWRRFFKLRYSASAMTTSLTVMALPSDSPWYFACLRNGLRGGQSHIAWPTNPQPLREQEKTCAGPRPSQGISNISRRGSLPARPNLSLRDFKRKERLELRKVTGGPPWSRTEGLGRSSALHSCSTAHIAITCNFHLANDLNVRLN